MRFDLRSLLAFSALMVAGTLQAQDYPTRPVRVLVPYTPGGITDLVTRIAAAELAKSFSQTVVVDNRPGANSILAVDMLSKATPDGYTLGTVIAAHAANQTLYAKLPYDSIKSFEHVSLLGTAPLIVCATNSLPAKSAKALGMASEKRVAVAPELPTLIESGVNVVGGTWVGLLAPLHTPKPVVDKLA